MQTARRAARGAAQLAATGSGDRDVKRSQTLGVSAGGEAAFGFLGAESVAVLGGEHPDELVGVVAEQEDAAAQVAGLFL